MKKIVFYAAIILLIISSCAQNGMVKDKDVTTYYLIRHAEKDRSDETNRNPDLTEEGQIRAENWANYFSNVKFDAVYSTDYNRTIQTATPTAQGNDLTLQFYDANSLDIDAFKIKTKGKTVLVVGHSDTTPVVTNRLVGEEKYDAIADDNNANLYMVTLRKDSKKSTLMVVE